jgi:hypothetical protein
MQKINYAHIQPGAICKHEMSMFTVEHKCPICGSKDPVTPKLFVGTSPMGNEVWMTEDEYYNRRIDELRGK